MSMSPAPTGEPSSVSYHFEEGTCECVVGKVAVDDSSVVADTTRPVVFEVLGDDDGVCSFCEQRVRACDCVAVCVRLAVCPL